MSIVPGGTSTGNIGLLQALQKGLGCGRGFQQQRIVTTLIRFKEYTTISNISCFPIRSHRLVRSVY